MKGDGEYVEEKAKRFEIRYGDGQQQRQRMSDSLTALLSTVASIVQDVGNGVVNMTLRDASLVCSSVKMPANHHDRNNHSLLLWNIIFLAVGSMIAHAVLLVRKKTRRTFGAIGEHPDVGAEDQSEVNHMAVPLLRDQEERAKMRLSLIDVSERKKTTSVPKSLMFHGSIHPFARYSFLIVLIGTMILFLASNLSTGTTVDLVLTGANGGRLSFPSLFSFSLGNTVREMYKAGIYPLMLLILVFSGIWPYLKLAMMIFAWVAPMELFSHAQREKLLIWLDALGKYSLVDAFVLVLMLVSFRYHFEVDHLGALDVYVTPMFGFYSFLLATIVSLISGHVMLFLHRRATLQHTIVSSGPKESLRQHVYEDYETGTSIRLSRRFQLVIFVTLLLTHILLGIGVGVKCFNFEFLGLGGLILGDDRLKSYSLLSLGSSISQSVENSSSFGIRWIQITFYFFAFVMPFTCLGMMLLIFGVPMELKLLRRSFMILEIARAWGALDVFLVSIVAALLEISQFSRFIMGDRCNLINSFLRDFFDKELHGKDVCYDVRTTISGNSWYLFTAVFLNSCVTFILLRFAHQAIDERIEREGQPKDISKAMEHAERASKNSLVTCMRRGYLGRFLFDDCSHEVSPDGYSILHRDDIDAAGHDDVTDDLTLRM